MGRCARALAEEALDLALLWQTEDQGPGLGLCPLAWIAHSDWIFALCWSPASRCRW